MIEQLSTHTLDDSRGFFVLFHFFKLNNHLKNFFPNDLVFVSLTILIFLFPLSSFAGQNRRPKL